MPAVSVFYECIESVKAAIDAVGLTGWTSVIRTYPSRKDATLPFISVGPGPGGVQVVDSTNLREEIVYPILVALFAADDATTLDARLLQIQRIRRALHNKPLTGITLGTFQHCKIAPLTTIDWQALKADAGIVSPMICRVTVREARTTS